jgi:hypothetical protein
LSATAQNEIDGIERKPWPDFLSYLRSPKPNQKGTKLQPIMAQGDHISAIGPTNSGKTNLMLQLLALRKNVVVFGTKRKDATLNPLLQSGNYLKVNEWSEGHYTSRLILNPPLKQMEDIARQKAIFDSAIRQIFMMGGWCIYVDEIAYFVDQLGLSKHLNLLWQHGRSLGITLMGGTQRPYHIPLAAYSQATHLFLWRNNDRRDVQRLSEISGQVDKRLIQDTIPQLERFDALYVNTEQGDLFVVHPPQFI